MESNAKDKFEEHLERGEILIDAYLKKDYTIPKEVLAVLLVVGVGLLLYGHWGLGGALLAIVSFDFLLKLIQYLTTVRGYAVTSEKVMILYGAKRVKVIPCREIFGVTLAEVGDAKAVLRISLDPRDSVFSNNSIIIETRKRTSHVLSRFQKEWVRRSPYIAFIGVLNSFLKQHQLKEITLRFSEEADISIEGEVEGMPFSMNIDSMLYPSELQASITCRNDEDNYFSLRREKDSDSIRKVLGMQDFLIGDEWLDERFVIQSNHEPFIREILGRDSIQKIKASQASLLSAFSMGSPQKMKEYQQIIEEGQSLDEHLIGSVDRRLRQGDNHSALNLKSEKLKEIKDYEVLGKSVVVQLELLIHLAQKINRYNDDNLSF